MNRRNTRFRTNRPSYQTTLISYFPLFEHCFLIINHSTTVFCIRPLHNFSSRLTTKIEKEDRSFNDKIRHTFWYGSAISEFGWISLSDRLDNLQFLENWRPLATTEILQWMNELAKSTAGCKKAFPRFTHSIPSLAGIKRGMGWDVSNFDGMSIIALHGNPDETERESSRKRCPAYKFIWGHIKCQLGRVVWVAAL